MLVPSRGLRFTLCGRRRSGPVEPLRRASLGYLFLARVAIHVVREERAWAATADHRYPVRLMDERTQSWAGTREVAGCTAQSMCRSNSLICLPPLRVLDRAPAILDLRSASMKIPKSCARCRRPSSGVSFDLRGPPFVPLVVDVDSRERSGTTGAPPTHRIGAAIRMSRGSGVFTHEDSQHIEDIDGKETFRYGNARDLRLTSLAR
ncbi:hypothetical protein C8R47DRAFT_674442 [Mycena vitilis]|nr:hypothetical protein C8R47DRAFT_674442 [Mycena vitilis]